MSLKALRFGAIKTQAVPQPAAIELLRIELNPVTNRLSVRLAEQPITNVDNIANEALRVEVQKLLDLLTPEQAKPAPVAAVPSTASTPAEPEPLIPSDDDELNAPLLQRVIDSLKRQSHYRTLNSVQSVKPMSAPRKTADKEPTVNMFAQVDAILQRIVREHHDSPPIEIFGDEQPLIRVGDQVYSQVDAVPDARAREHIHAAVAEWEARQLRLAHGPATS